jgi:hypothetical protein
VAGRRPVDLRERTQGRRLSFGAWSIRRAGEPARQIAVPGGWEDAGYAKDDAGPFTYSTTFEVGSRSPDTLVSLRFGAVSYACTVLVDGVEVGRHVGMWTPFDVDITSVVRHAGDTAGDTAGSHRLEVIVEKPASLTAGPDSASGPGRYPVRSTLAGFLPYVWGHSHGGIWQAVEVVLTPALHITELDCWGDPDGGVHVVVTASGDTDGQVVVSDDDGVAVAAAGFRAGVSPVQVVVPVRAPLPWSPADPHLYTVSARLANGVVATARIGLRALRVGPDVAGSRNALWLNGEPFYPRMLLSWGWYPDRLVPDPGPHRVREDLELVRSLGFNGVKLCLWFPPPYYFDIADELGIALWVELPMWLPQPGESFGEQLRAETDDLVRLARAHPCVLLYTLGCELDATVGEEILAPQYRQVKSLVRDALVCDNSGSGEAYGGVGTVPTDFYDHHLYCELEHAEETFDYFAPGWRAPKPWLLGEFCDLDTYRDLRRSSAWWISADARVNPQGARWQFDVLELPERLKSGGWWERGEQLERISRHAALLHRKATLEIVRARADVAGYVVTGERDTPISTAGLLDDDGRLKVDPREFARANADTVFLLAGDRRREWTAGGDRPAPPDMWCHPCGAVVRMHLLVANAGPVELDPMVRWRMTDIGTGAVLGVGVCLPSDHLRGNGIHELTGIEVMLPAGDRPGVLELAVDGSVGGTPSGNRWRLWQFPTPTWGSDPAFTLLDPGRRFDELRGVATSGLQAGRVALATRWSPELELFVRAGGDALLALDDAADAPVPLVAEPFWREAVKVIEPHRWWGSFPHEGVVDLQFLGCATDRAMDLGGVGGVRPLLRRIDARTGRTHDYAAEVAVGKGKVLMTTLRFEGGRGSQPRGLTANVGAAYLLATWMRGLAADQLRSASPRR